jgi:exonuclease SbcC
MKLDRLILKDFLSFQDFDYKFENKPLLVQGLNLTEETQKSNGSGKSGMATGIEFCITATNSRDVRDSELVTYGKKQANAQLFASCDVRKESIHIDWTIKAKGSNQLTLTRKSYDGKWREISFSNVNDGKKWISNWFDISKEDLFNYFIINKSRFKSFFKSSNREKVALINRFSDASIIDGLEDIDNSQLETKKGDIQFNIAKCTGKIEAIDEELDIEKNRDLSADFELEKAKIIKSIAELQTEREEIEHEMEEDLKKKKSTEEDLKNANHLLSKINTIEEQAIKLVDSIKVIDHSDKKDRLEDKIKNKEIKLSKFENDNNALRDKKTKVEALIRSIEVKLGGSIECPSCEHEFILDGDLESLKQKMDDSGRIVGKIEDAIQTREKLIQKLESDIEDLDAKVSILEQEESQSKESLREKREALDNIKNEKRAVLNKVHLCENKLRDSQKDVKDLQDELDESVVEDKRLNKSLENLRPKDNRDRLEELRLMRDEQLELKTDFENQINEVGDEIYMRNQWTTNFKQFKGFVANQSLEVIEYHMNRYLNDMGSDLKVKMEGFKVLANGSIKDDIQAKIIRDVERSYSSFSGGERGRLLFASILANRHMINLTHKYGGLDYLNIDEIFEGVDSLGLKHLLESAKSLEISAHIITHVSDEDVSADVLTIVKENGVSRIKN